MSDGLGRFSFKKLLSRVIGSPRAHDTL